MYACMYAIYIILCFVYLLVCFFCTCVVAIVCVHKHSFLSVFLVYMYD